MESVTSPLLSEVHAILAGSHEVEKLSEAIDATRADLDALRADFQATVAREKEATRQLVSREIQAVDQAFEDYAAVLDCAAGYLQGFDRAYLESTAKHMPLAISRLDLNFLAFREAAMAERGPTTHPGINYLATLCALALEGADPGPAFERQLEFELVRSEMGVQPGQDPLAALRSEFYQRYLQHLDQCPGPGDRAWLDGLLALGRDYARLDLASLERRFAWQPTAVPALNLVLNGVWLWSQGRVAPEVCQLLLGQGHQFVLETLEAHQQLAAALPAGDSAAEAAVRGTQALESLLDLLEAYHLWLEDPGSASLDGLAQELIAAASELSQARDALEGTGASKVPCIICGLSNPPGSARCTQCGSKLGGGAFEVGEAPAEAPPGRLERLLEAASQLLQGFGQPDDLLQLVEEMRQSLVVARRKTPPLDEIAEDDPLRASAESYATAMDEMEAGLGELQTFAEDPSHEGLEKASALLLAAGEKLSGLQQTLSSNAP